MATENCLLSAIDIHRYKNCDKSEFTVQMNTSALEKKRNNECCVVSYRLRKRHKRKLIDQITGRMAECTLIIFTGSRKKLRLGLLFN